MKISLIIMGVISLIILAALIGDKLAIFNFRRKLNRDINRGVKSGDFTPDEGERLKILFMELAKKNKLY